MGYEDLQKAVVNRSLRSVKTELEFLKDANILTAQQYSSIVGNLPAEHAAPVQQRAQETPTPVQSNPVPAMAQLNMNNNTYGSNNEKNGYYPPAATPNVAPPAYPNAPQVPSTALATCSALYQYNAQDAGDLQLMPNDRIVVTEYMNAEWWKGRNERTGQEGIFPRSYVKMVEEKGPMMPSVPTHQPSNYGNAPQDVAHAGPSEPGKGAEMGKKFGKKLGNAAVFGAGATIGSKIVNGIF